MAQEDVFKKIVSHCKEYGFVFPSSEIYDGLGAVYDYGQNGVELKNNIKQYWWQSMVLLHENIVGIDSAIFMHPTIWKASGHVDAFNDPLIDNRDSKKRYRAEIDKIKGAHFDAAFVPLDPRQEEHYADGMLYFLKHVDCNAVFPMHYWNEPSVIDRFITEYPQYKSRIKNTESAKGEEI